MDLHPILSYAVKHLSWDDTASHTNQPFTWDLPMRASFHPFSIHRASMTWQDQHLGFLPPHELEKRFNGAVVLRGIQYVVTLTCDGKMWQGRFAHEFLGADKLATRLHTNHGVTVIENSGILFEPFEAHEVFDKVTGAAKHVTVMQFVS